MKTGWVPRFCGVVRSMAVTWAFGASPERVFAVAFLLMAVLAVSCGTSNSELDEREDVASLSSALCSQLRLTITPASPVPAGTAARLTATAACLQGDTAEFQFSRMRIGVDTTWVVVRPWASGTGTTTRTSTYQIPTNSPSGQYRFKVDLRQPGGGAETVTTLNVLLGNVCDVLVPTPQLGDPPSLGTAITLQGLATCTGTNTQPQYQFEYEHSAPGSIVELLPPDWSLSRERTWGTQPGLLSGRYWITTRSRANGNASTFEALLRQSYLLGDVCTHVTLTPPEMNQPTLDGSLRLTASARCLRTAEPRYQFLYRQEIANAVNFIPLTGEWGPGALDWNVSGLSPGLYGVTARVRGHANSSDYEAMHSLGGFLVGTTCHAATLQVSPLPPQAPGTSVRLDATAACAPGASPLFKFVLLPNGTGGYVTVRDWSPVASATWPANATGGRLSVWVKANGNQSEPYEAVAVETYTVTPRPNLPACTGTGGAANFCDGCLCGAGKGNCDGGNECAAGLVCIRDAGPHFSYGATTDVCLPNHCANRVRDAAEQGVDCGGPCIPCLPACSSSTPPSSTLCRTCSCSVGQGDCDWDYQCRPGQLCSIDDGPKYGRPSGYDVCVPAHCMNNTRDSGETGVDCGGECGACLACAGPSGDDDFCRSCSCGRGQGDCDSDRECGGDLVCAVGLKAGPRFGLPATTDVCVPAHCTNDHLDAELGETGVDCGGECGACLNRCTGTSGGEEFCGTCACSSGQGDCDAHRDCRPGLYCAPDLGAQFGFAATTDVCVPESEGGQAGSGGTGGTGGTSGGGGTGGACQTNCATKVCGDDPADGCGGICADLCVIGEAGCQNTADCPPGSVCGIGVGPHFGLPAGTNVCWPRECQVQDPSLPNGGVSPAQCGSSPACVPSCEPGSTGPNGCGGFCGPCGAGQSRDSNGTCVATGQLLNRSGVDFPIPLTPMPTDPVGAIPGAFSVSDTGMALYSIPIEVPPGRAGMQPSLALSYISTKADGMLGIGWSLTGMSSIRRCSKIPARDGVARGVKHDAEDLFCLDGQALIANNGPYGGHGTLYRTEIDSFSHVYSWGEPSVNGTYFGPRYFEVWAKDGRILRYGTRLDSSAVLSGPLATGIKRVWALDEVEDVSGNTMTIRYRPHNIVGSIAPATPSGPVVAISETGEMVPSAIHYGGTKSGSQAHSRSVSFEYQPRPTRLHKYLAGRPVLSSERMAKITTRVGTQVVKEYRLHYAPTDGGTPDVEQIQRVEECAPDAASAGQFRCRGHGTVFEYGQTPPTGFVQAFPGGIGPAIYDMNGDAKNDLFSKSGTQVVALINTTTVPGLPAYTAKAVTLLDHVDDNPASSLEEEMVECTSGAAVDLEGDGRMELVCREYVLTVQAESATTIVFRARRVVTPSPIWTGPDTRMRLSQFSADFNGDGLPDFASCPLGILGEGVRIAINQGNGTVSLEPALGLVCGPDQRMFAVDLDLDGRDEFLNPQGAFGARVAPGVWESPALAPMPLFVLGSGDFNGDGIKDVVGRMSDNVYTVSLGNSAGGLDMYRVRVEGTTPTRTATLLVFDWDGDGRDDLVGDRLIGRLIDTQLIRFTAGPQPFSVATLLAPDLNGDGDAEIVDRVARTIVYSTARGTRRLLSAVQDGLGRRTEVRYDKFQLTDAAILVPTYTPGAPCASAGVSYRCLASAGTVVSSHQEIHAVLDPITGLTQVAKPGPRYRYTYSAGRRGLGGRGFYGFEQRSVFLVGGLLETSILYNATDHVRAGLRRLITTKQSGTPESFISATSGSYVTEHLFTWLPREVAPGVQFPYLDNEVTRELEGGLESHEVSKQITHRIVDNEGSEVSRATVDYVGPAVRTTLTSTPRFSRGRVRGLAGLFTVTDDLGGASVTRTMRTTYDNEGRTKIVEREPADSGSLYRRVTLERDGFGNVKRSCVDNGSGVIRCTSIDAFDADAIYPQTVRQERTDGPALITRVTHAEEDGQLLVVVDPAGRVHETAYDVFGRIQQIEAPTVSKAVRYENVGRSQTPFLDVTAFGALAIRENSLGSGETVTVLDAFGRMVAANSPGALNSRVLTEQEFDDFGRLRYQTTPHAPGDATQGFTTYGYDSRHRLTEIRPPAGAPINIGYTNRRLARRPDWFTDPAAVHARAVISPTPKFMVSAEVVDQRGLVRRAVRRELGDGGRSTATSYQYLPFDFLSTITTENDVIAQFPDLWGRVVSRFETSTGVTTFQYNGFDELEEEGDATGTFKNYVYDQVGRLIEQRDATGALVVKSVYDEGANGAGLLTSSFRRSDVGSGGTWIRHTINSRGLPDTTTYRVGATATAPTSGEAFNIQYRYQTAVPWRVGAVSYPAQGGAFAVKYGYDAAGALTRVGPPLSLTNPNPNPVENDPTPYWQLLEADQGIRSKRERFGNGIHTFREFYRPSDCVLGVHESCEPGLLKELRTQIGEQTSTNPVFYERYSYDVHGNVVRKRTDPVANLAEIYTYDWQDQLATVGQQLGGPVVPDLSYSPDVSGNLRSIGPAVYAYDSVRPQHLVSITNGSAITQYGDYFADGNLRRRSGAGVPGSAQSFTYNDLDLPIAIQTGTTTTSGTYFAYDAAAQRVSKVVELPGHTPQVPRLQTTTYITDLYERTTSPGAPVAHTYKVYAGGQQIANITRQGTGGALTVRYLHADRLGSTRFISDENATDGTAVVESRRYGVYGETNPFDPASRGGTSGFTGHEHDGDLGLINMKGRMYDPLAKRFMSADPILADSGSAIGLNPYAYVRNNPTNLVDPSGFTCYSVTNSQFPGIQLGQVCPQVDPTGGTGATSGGPSQAEMNAMAAAASNAAQQAAQREMAAAMHNEDAIRSTQAGRGLLGPVQEAGHFSWLSQPRPDLGPELLLAQAPIPLQPPPLVLPPPSPPLSQPLLEVIAGEVVHFLHWAFNKKGLDRIGDTINQATAAGLLLASAKEAQRDVERGRGPREITRIDSPDPRYPGTQWEAHTGGKGSPALKLDGTWKHIPNGGKPPSLSRQTLQWLKEHGWNIP